MNHHVPDRVISTPETLVTRIHPIIGTVALDCDCRQRVNDSLGRFIEMEQQRETRRHLLSSRHQLAAIATLVDLLAELEEISWQAVDRSVFCRICAAV
ncbi:hypothetical protein [Martelella soudanensis]|uniref:hypothetical protein n=1 Tax=unclassified Martelella TaxID=2629616 RepID=UPI0015DF4165|nr:MULTISPECIES: hypothetical protein [unclassified Martelella]